MAVLLLTKALIVSGKFNMRWCALQIPAACAIFLALSKKYTSQLVINFEERIQDGFAGEAVLGKHTWEMSATPGARHSRAGSPCAPPGRAAEQRTHGPALRLQGFYGMRLALLELWIELRTDSAISGNAYTVYRTRNTVKGTICTG